MKHCFAVDIFLNGLKILAKQEKEHDGEYEYTTVLEKRGLIIKRKKYGTREWEDHLGFLQDGFMVNLFKEN